MLRVVHQVAQSVGHDPGFHLCSFFRGLGPAAVKLKVHLVLHNGLVTAPAQGHLQSKAGVFIQGLKLRRLPAHADRERGVYPLARLHRAHIIQDGKAAGGEFFVSGLVQNHQIAVPVGFHQQRAAPAPPLVHFLLHSRPHGGALALRAGAHEILVVVDHDDGHHRPCLGQGRAHMLQICHIHPVGGGQHAHMPRSLGPGQAAEYPVAPSVPGKQARELRLSLQDPVGLKALHHVPHPGLENILPHTRQVREQVVGPKHVIVLGIKDHHGHGGKEHVAVFGGIGTAGYALHILVQLLLHNLTPPATDIPHRQGSGHLADGQSQRYLRRDCGK